MPKPSILKDPIGAIKAAIWADEGSAKTLPVGSGGAKRAQSIDDIVNSAVRGDDIARRRKNQHAPGNK